ncbi:hypothetical protein ACTWJ8_40635 (plasmid) [Streptomyces sp. SDT5-1]|uniref:hypothetical protein n=1 Tax=Streptomyces sp. SDT5-1 TaxID=3406418 RepID=UPI003FD2DAC1
MRRLLACVAVSATATGALLLAGAGGAQAYPQGCSTQIYLYGGQAYCTTGTGAFRVKVTCKPSWGNTYAVYGRWAAPGLDVSVANCYADDHATNVMVEKRNP